MRGDPITAPSNGLWISQLNLECTFFVQTYNDSFDIDLGIFMTILFSPQTLLKMITMVPFKGIFVNTLYVCKK